MFFPINNKKAELQIKVKKNKTIMTLIRNKLEYDTVHEHLKGEGI